MSGKSLNQVWKEMQSQRQQQIQRQLSEQRAIEEKAERARKEYVQKMKMFEKTAVAAAAASSAAAGAAGAGGAGGGSGKRRRETPIQISTQQSTIFYTNTDGQFKFFIYNYGTNIPSPIITLTGDWSGSDGQVVPTTLGGFYIQIPNYSLNQNQMYFVDLNANILWQDTNTYGDLLDYEDFSRYVAVYYLKDGVYKLAILDDDNFKYPWYHGNVILEIPSFIWEKYNLNSQMFQV